MTEPAPRRCAALVMSVGLGIAFFSIVAESLGLGSGNGTLGTWQKTGLAIGLVTMVGGALWFSKPGLVTIVGGALRFSWAALVMAAAIGIAILSTSVSLLNADPIDSAKTCEELEDAREDVVDDARESGLWADADADIPRYLNRMSQLGCLGQEL